MFSTTEITSAEISSDNPIHQRLLLAYIAAAERVEGNVLEVGCGVGRGIEVLLEATPHYTAIDKNSQLIDQLQHQYPKAQFFCQNIPPIRGLPLESYDWIVSFQVIEHIEKDELFVAELYRLLRKGGKLLITTPNRKLSLTRNPWHIREYTAPELENLLKKYFPKVESLGVQGNEKIQAYYEANKKAVERITRWDFLNLQYRLPRRWLQVPYDILNRLNRKGLQKKNTNLVDDITYQDYFVTDQAEDSLDLFFIAEK
jgi:SAM-dependent methyltransferase